MPRYDARRFDPPVQTAPILGRPRRDRPLVELVRAPAFERQQAAHRRDQPSRVR